VNASAAAVPREDEVQSKIRKVRTFGRTARAVCAAVFGFGLVGSVVMLFLIVLGPIAGSETTIRFGGGGFYTVSKAMLTTLQFKVSAFLVVGVVTGIWLSAVFQLYRLFGSLAAGAIYTPGKVRRVRYVGLLWLLAAVLGIVIPAALLVARGFIDTSVPIDLDVLFPSVSQLAGDFVSAGLILLASWIMDVGLYEKDHADELKREADLVI
jgi:hypothetical protein